MLLAGTRPSALWGPSEQMGCALLLLYEIIYETSSVSTVNSIPLPLLAAHSQIPPHPDHQLYSQSQQENRFWTQCKEDKAGIIVICLKVGKMRYVICNELKHDSLC